MGKVIPVNPETPPSKIKTTKTNGNLGTQKRDGDADIKYNPDLRIRKTGVDREKD